MNTLERVARISLWFLGLCFIAIGLGWLPAPALGAKNQAPKQPLAKLSENLLKADRLFAKRDNPKNANAALSIYQQEYKSGNQDSNTAWRLSMAKYFVGLRLTNDSDQKKELFESGRRVARRALRQFPNCAPCHFWSAVNTALYGETRGTLSSFILLHDVRKHLRKVIELDETYAYGGAYRISGLIQQKLPSALGGSKKRAEDLFKRAIAVAPSEPMNYLFLAKLLLNSDSQRKPEAMSWILEGLSHTPPKNGQVESVEARAELEQLVSELKISLNAQPRSKETSTQ